MSSLVSDTHAAIWYLSRSPRLSTTAHSAIQTAILGGDPVFVASITLVEIVYLIDKGRMPATTFGLLERTLADPASGFVLVPLDVAVARTVGLVSRSLVPDMPDCIIAPTALLLGLPL